MISQTGRLNNENEVYKSEQTLVQHMPSLCDRKIENPSLSDILRLSSEIWCMRFFSFKRNFEACPQRGQHQNRKVTLRFPSKRSQQKEPFIVPCIPPQTSPLQIKAHLKRAKQGIFHKRKKHRESCRRVRRARIAECPLLPRRSLARRHISPSILRVVSPSPRRRFRNLAVV